MGVKDVFPKMAFVFVVCPAQLVADIRAKKGGGVVRAGVDVSVIFHSVCRRKAQMSRPSVGQLAKQVFERLRQMASWGFQLVVVFDKNSETLWWKASSWQRRQKAMRRLVELKRLQQKDDKSPADVASLKNLAASLARPPAGLADELRRVVAAYESGAGGGQPPILFVDAPHQADSQLAHLYMTKDVDAVVSSDSDILLLGCDLLIREGCFALPGGGAKVAGSNVVAASFTRPDFFLTVGPVKEPALPIFLPTDTPRQRAAWAVLLGCDVLPGGVVGCGGVKLYKHLAGDPDRDVDTALKAFTGTPRAVPLVVVEMAIDAFMFEHVLVGSLADIAAGGGGGGEAGAGAGAGVGAGGGGGGGGVGAKGYRNGVNPPRRIDNCLAPLRLPRDRVRQVVARAGSPLTTFQCAVGHRSIEHFGRVHCAAGGHTLCCLCAGVGAGASEFTCGQCELAGIAGAAGAGVVTLQPALRGHLRDGGLSLTALFSLMGPSDNPATDVDRRMLAAASDTEMVAFLRAVGSHGFTQLGRAALMERVLRVAKGEVVAFVHDDSPGFAVLCEKAQVAVAAGTVDRALVPWAFKSDFATPEAPALHEFAADFFYSCCQPEEILFMLRLLGALAAPVPSKDNPTMSRPLLLASARAVRLLGGCDRILSYGVRGAVAPWTLPLTDARVAVVRHKEDNTPLLYIAHTIHASMRSKEYKTKVWINEHGLQFAECTCVVGASFCFHAFVILSQLELLALLPTSTSLAAVVLDAYCDRVGCDSIVDAHIPLLRHVVHIVHPDNSAISDDDIRRVVLPQTSRRVLVSYVVEAHAHMPASEIVIRSPRTTASLLQQKGTLPSPSFAAAAPAAAGAADVVVDRDTDEAEAAGGDIEGGGAGAGESFNPFPPRFDPNFIDYVRIFRIAETVEEVCDTVWFFLVALRAADQFEKEQNDRELVVSQRARELRDKELTLARQLSRLSGRRRRRDSDGDVAGDAAAAAATAVDTAAVAAVSAASAAEAAGTPEAHAPNAASFEQAVVTQHQRRLLGDLVADDPADDDGVDAGCSTTGTVTDGGEPLPKRTRYCGFVKCGCTTVSCPHAFRRSPARSVASKKATREKRKLFRSSWLRRVGAHPNAAQVDICRCHPLDDKTLPLAMGVVASAPPQRSMTPAAERRQPYFRQPVDSAVVELGLAHDRIEQQNEEIDALRRNVRAAVVKADRQPLRYARLIQNKKSFTKKTKFRSPLSMEMFLFFLCNGDLSVLEELRVYSPNGKGKSAHEDRTLDYRDMFLMLFMREATGDSLEALAAEFVVSYSTADRAIATCAAAVELRRHAFGLFPSYSECEALTPADWKAKYPGLRVHLWDMTNINLAGTPRDAQLNKLTYSSYYSANCLKGGVGMTAFGYIFLGPLYTGGIGDSEYMVDSNLLAAQEDLATRDGGPPVTNMTDKGYRLEDEAHAAGEQTFLTPCFKRAGTAQFDPLEAAVSFSVARDRARNEQAVLRPCSFGYIYRGIKLGSNLRFANRMWENIGFRCSFVFRPLSLAMLPAWEEMLARRLADAGLVRRAGAPSVPPTPPPAQPQAATLLSSTPPPSPTL